MCIICSSAIGQELPTDKTIEIMWNSNPDGAGFMFNKNGEVVIRKGFMTLTSFKDAIAKLKTEIDVINTAVVMHFRIGTQGGNIPENTHPFPITDKEPLLKRLNHRCSIGMAHNGIITCVKPRTDISDTMEYVEEVLAYLKADNPEFYQNKGIQKLIENTINGSRMCFLNGNGEITYVGNWVEDKDTKLMYSNKNYLYDPYMSYYYDYRSKSKDKSKKYGKYGWDWDEGYDDDGYGYPYSFDTIGTTDKAEKNIQPRRMMFMEEGYVIFENGEMFECEEDVFLIDSDNRVYRYNEELEAAVLLSGVVAYSNTGTFFAYKDDKAILVEWITERTELAFLEEIKDYETMTGADIKAANKSVDKVDDKTDNTKTEKHFVDNGGKLVELTHITDTKLVD